MKEQPNIGPMELVTPEIIENKKKKEEREIREREERAKLFPSDEEIEQALRDYYSKIPAPRLDEIIKLQLIRKHLCVKYSIERYANFPSIPSPTPPESQL